MRAYRRFRVRLTKPIASKLDKVMRDVQRVRTVLSDRQRQPIIATVCSDPPEGRTRWTVWLVAEEAP